ncbi:MAG: lysine--tRNA ligase [Acidobacteriota bacterium]
MANCFRCGRFLGELDEWKKMDTEKGAICYMCFNEIGVAERMSRSTSEEIKKHWADQEVDRILSERKEYHLSTGISPSGEIHIGNLREVVTADAIYRVLKERGVDADFHYIADDFDPLRKVYPFLDQAKYQPLVGKPLSEIPCPCERHNNYAEHFLLPFIESLKQLRIELKVYRASEVYKSKMMNPLVIQAMKKRDKLMEILEEMTGRKFEGSWFPFNPICNRCGRMTETTITAFSEEEETVSYACLCGDSGTVPMGGGGKLTWRVDWPARWRLFGVTVEPFGKDHATRGGSYDTGIRIMREVFEGEPPYPVPYEWISLKGMGDMSSSKGNVLSIEKVLTVVPPEIIRYMILKTKPLKSIAFDPGLPLLSLIDEYDDLESKRRDERAIILSRAAGFKSIDIPFRHIVVVAQIANFDIDNAIEILRRSGYLQVDREELERRMIYAKRWLAEFAPEEVKFEVRERTPEEAGSLSESQKRFLRILAERIGDRRSGEEIHQLIYSIAEEIEGVEPYGLFEAIYLSILGKERGPRAGWFLAFLDRQFVINRFQDAAGSKT